MMTIVEVASSASTDSRAVRLAPGNARTTRYASSRATATLSTSYRACLAIQKLAL